MSQNPRLTNNQTTTKTSLEATVNNTTTKAYYTIEDQLEVYGQNTYRYDDDGYLQEKTTPEGTTTYSYGTLGELKQVTTPTQSISYQHNANNQRVAKLINNQVVEKYLWADLTTLLAIYDNNDNLVQRFEYADSRMPVAMTDSNGTKYYLHYDQVGTLKAVSDTSHNIVKEISYDTFGNILTDSNPTFKVPFGFAGGLYDSHTKLTRFGYRDYDAYTGKWTAKDPIGFSGGDSNLYGYVLGDPVNFRDPFGLRVYLCKAPVDGVPIGNHHWIKTDTLERGMWNDNDRDDWYDNVPFFAHVAVRDEDYNPNAMCLEIPNVNEEKVNKQLRNFRPLGIWTPWNQCQSFASDVLKNAGRTEYNDNHTTSPTLWVPRSSL